MHLRKPLSLLVTLLSLFLVAEKVTAQVSVEQQATLNQLSKQYSLQFQKEKQAALRRADSLGIPVRQEFENGRVIELMRFVNEKPIYISTNNADGAILIKTDVVYDGGSANLSLSGSGETLGFWDSGLPRFSHQEFGGRVIQSPDDTYDDAPTQNDGHATQVAGTMVASGNFVSDAKGMAFNASIDSYEWDYVHSEMTTAAGNGLRLSVHPYSYSTGWEEIGSNWYWLGDATAAETEDYSFGFYDETYAAKWDTIAYEAPNYLIVTTAGNDRGEIAPESIRTSEEFLVYNGSTFEQCKNYSGCNNNYEEDGGGNGFDSISYNGLAKNILTVGAVDASVDRNLLSSSGFGPTDDGRIKPDIMAKGVDVHTTSGGSNSAYSEHATGTSYAAPMIGGSIGLLLEHQQNLHEGNILLSSTLKALVLHTADNLGNPGPDYKYGWGLMNTQKAAEVMSNNDEDAIHIMELTLHDGETISFPVRANGNEPLRATIVWTDIPGEPADISTNPSKLMLVNDLDMRILDPSDDTKYPYTLDPSDPNTNAQTNTDNFRDNVEMIHIDSPVEDEIYTISISHKNTLENNSQDFSLIITGNEAVDYELAIDEGNGEGWRFLSSPVPTATYQSLLNSIWTQGSDNSDYPPATEANILMYDGSDYSAINNLNTPIDTGSGFAVLVYEDDNFDNSPDDWPKYLTATGMENLHDVDVSNLLNSGNDTFTLLGNPFHSTIDFDSFDKNSDIGNTVYVYDHSFDPGTFDEPDEDGGDAGGGFRAWNGSAGSLTGGLIAPFQGFFVFASGNSPEITIPTTAKTDASSTFYKEKKSVPVLQIVAQLNSTYSAETWFSFSETGSLERNGNDAPYLYPLDYKPFLSIRTKTDELGYLIKNLPASLTEPLKIPISVEAWRPDENSPSSRYVPLGGTVEMAWPKLQNIPQSWTITLTDHQNGSIVDLKKRSRYTFTLSDLKAKVQSLPYSLKLEAAEATSGVESRFTLTIYPEPFAGNQTEETPSEFNLSQNYPNPFNPSTVIRYSLPQTSDVELDIFTIDGQKVATLVNSSQSAGNHTLTFDGSDLSSGVYIYRLTTGRQIISRKMILIK